MQEQWTIMVPTFITITGDKATLQGRTESINRIIKNAVNEAFYTESDDKLADRIHNGFEPEDIELDVIEVEVSDPTTTHIAHI